MSGRTEFARWLDRIALDREMTMADVARELGISQGTIARWRETIRPTRPKPATVRSLEVLFGMPDGYVAGLVGYGPRVPLPADPTPWPERTMRRFQALSHREQVFVDRMLDALEVLRGGGEAEN